MFDKILSRLGIYDLLGVLITGICISTTSLLLLRTMRIHIELIRDEPFLFFIFSYILGLVFQELASFVQRNLIHKKNRLRSKAVKTKKNHYLYMEEYEIDRINEYVRQALLVKDKKTPINLKEDTNIIFNHCKNYMAKHGDMTGCNRDQAIAGMARSLSLYCFFAPLFFLLLFSPCGNGYFSIWFYILVSGALLLFSVLFYYRFRRFTLRRIIKIYRYYLYNQVLSEKNNSTSKEKMD